jgi:hypothetical protein
MNTKTWILISLLAFILLAIPGINHGLWRPDELEGRTFSEISRTGDFVVPHLNASRSLKNQHFTMARRPSPAQFPA